jgi:hypothetical protein
MPTDLEKTAQSFNDTDSTSCPMSLSLLQLAFGVLLMAASVYGYTMLNDVVVAIPALMGLVLVATGVKAILLGCESSPLRDALRA